MAAPTLKLAAGRERIVELEHQVVEKMRRMTNMEHEDAQKDTKVDAKEHDSEERNGTIKANGQATRNKDELIERLLETLSDLAGRALQRSLDGTEKSQA